MKRKKIVAGNWKMNTNLSEAQDLVKSIQSTLLNFNEIEKIIFPPFPFIKSIKMCLQQDLFFHVGAQNCSAYSSGSYTGDVSASMLNSVGCEYVIIGHSERRQYFHENDAQINLKIEQALLSNLKIIFCVGEQLSDRKNNIHFEVIKIQLTNILDKIPNSKISQLIIAYEPIWAIGSGENASPEIAQEMHVFIRSIVMSIFNYEVSNMISILYGGSCNSSNSKQLFACNDIDGGLIGGASLKADEFCKIINSF